MTPQQFLRYQLALLLASNGQDSLLTCLSDLMKLSTQELDVLIKDIEKLDVYRAKKPKRATAQASNIERLAAQNPEKADQLRALNTRLENRTLFAELRDVRRFLESHSIVTKSLKSRTDALPKLLNVLATLDLSELKSLVESPSSADYSSLGVISDHILRRDQS